MKPSQPETKKRTAPGGGGGVGGGVGGGGGGGGGGGEGWMGWGWGGGGGFVAPKMKEGETPAEHRGSHLAGEGRSMFN